MIIIKDKRKRDLQMDETVLRSKAEQLDALINSKYAANRVEVDQDSRIKREASIEPLQAQLRKVQAQLGDIAHKREAAASKVKEMNANPDGSYIPPSYPSKRSAFTAQQKAAYLAEFGMSQYLSLDY